MNLDPINRDILIRTVLGEAAREPLQGQAGVAAVVLNRLNSGRHGKDVQDVVFQKKAFEPWETRRKKLLAYKPESDEYKKAAAIVDGVASGQIADPTGGATHFLNEDIVRKRRGGSLPKWAAGEGQKIARHTFYAPEGRVESAAMQQTQQMAEAQPAQAPAVQPVSDPGLLERLKEGWGRSTFIRPMAESIAGAITLPGDVYQGKVDPRSDEAIERAADLAGSVTLGAGAVPAKAGAEELRMGIKAYHGSPHDFDKFDMSKIGTGEGAQAYGHGLYFAGNEQVAQEYKRALGGKGQIDGINARMSELAAIMERDSVPGAYRKYKTPVGEDAAREYDDLMEKRSNLGHMYEVDINADPEQFLDWDKPLSEQNAGVKQAIKDNIFYAPKHEQAAIRRALDGNETAYERDWSPVTGGNFVKQMPTGTERILNKEGIPGIRYLDQGSRGSGEGTSNYVVFDDKLITILKKYGLPLTAGGVATLTQLYPEEASAAQAGAAQQSVEPSQVGLQPVTDPAILERFGGGQQPTAPLPAGQEVGVPMLPGKEMGVGGAFRGGFTSDETEALRNIASSLYPEEPVEQSVQRFGRENGVLFHIGDDGQRYRALPEGMSLQGIANSLAEIPGKALPLAGGLVVGGLTAPAAMAGPGGLAASLALTGSAAGAGEYARQKIGDKMLGDASTNDVNELAIASEAGSSLVGQGAGAGIGKMRTNQAVRDIEKLDPVATQQAYREAQAVDVPITPAEATGLPTLAAQQKRLTNITPTADKMRTFLTERDTKVRAAFDGFLDTVSKARDAEDVGRVGRDAAETVLGDMRAELSAAAKPLYDAAYAKPIKMTAGLQEILKRPVMQRAMKAAQELAENDGRTFNAANPTVQNLDDLKRSLDDILGSSAAMNEKTGGRNQYGRSVNNLRLQLLDEMDTQVPEYAQARSVYSTGAEDVTSAMGSILRTLADTKDVNLVKTAQQIFNPRARSPEMVRRLRNQLTAKNPEAWQGLKRLYVEDVATNALRTAESGDVINPAGKIVKAFSDPRLQKNLEAAMTDTEFNRLRDLMVVFRRASSVPALRSDTEFNRLMTKEANDAARGVLAKIAGRNVNVFAWGKAAEEFITNQKLERNAKQVVDLITSGDPQVINTMKELRRLSPKDKRWTILFGHLLSRTAGAGLSAGIDYLSPEPDYQPSAAP